MSYAHCKGRSGMRRAKEWRHERKIRHRPQFRNPDYLGSAKLADKVALITGGDSGIGRAVAVRGSGSGVKS